MDQGHVGSELAGGSPVRLGNLLRHALLRAAPVRGRHTHPGPDLALYDGRRPPGAPGHLALRRLAYPRGNHRQPIPLGPGAVHPDLLPHLGRDGSRLLDAPRRSRLRPRSAARRTRRARLVRAPPRRDRPARSHAVVEFRGLGQGWPVGIPPGAKDGHSATDHAAVRLRVAAGGRAGGRLRSAERGSALPYPRPEADRRRAGEGVGSGPWPFPRFPRGQW